jgi:hypothetical protein
MSRHLKDILYWDRVYILGSGLLALVYLLKTNDLEGSLLAFVVFYFLSALAQLITMIT